MSRRLGRTMRILGISAFYHDSAACLVVDGELVAAAQEERFTRKKHDLSYPAGAVEYCLSCAGIEGKDLDYVVFYEKPLIKQCFAGNCTAQFMHSSDDYPDFCSEDCERFQMQMDSQDTLSDEWRDGGWR